MGSTRSTIADLVPVVDSAERKLSSSLCMLNQGSKLTLLNSLLTSIAIFPLCTIKFPPKLVDHLDKIRRRCLWRKKTERGETCNSLALWDLVCRPKNHGGLGVLDVKVRNLALLLKFLHSFYKKKDVPWANLIWSMYYVDKVPHATDPCGSFWWRDVMQLSDTYGGIMKVEVGDGSTALFWKDQWHDKTLDESHPRAFSFTKLEDVSVLEFLGINDLQIGFHLPLSSEARLEVQHI